MTPLVILSTDDFRARGETPETPPGPQPPSDPEPGSADGGGDSRGSGA